MKQFARCTNCRQWYVHKAVETVEVFRGSGQTRTTLWCQTCIQETERRSEMLAELPAELPEKPAAILPPAQTAVSLHVSEHSQRGVSSGDTQQLIQEHLDLMERALHEDDTTIILLVEDFIDRCETHVTLELSSEDTSRLQGQLQYWASFLNAMKPEP